MSLLDNASLLLTPNAYKEGKLYSVIPSNGNGDFTATRATTATRVNAAGLVDLVPYNLLQQSETFTSASWGKNALGINTSIGASGIEANIANAPNGTLTADRVNFILQSDLDIGLFANYSIATTGQSFVGSIYVKGEGSNIGKQIKLRIKRSTGGSFVGVDTTITLTSDWVQITSSALTLLANNSGVQYSMSSNDATNALIWGAQLVEGTSARDYLRTETRLNIPRVDYSLGGCPNILLEPQRTNLALQSSSFDSVSWLKTSSSVTANTTTSPSGIIDADTFAGDGNLAVHLVGCNVISPIGVASISIYAKKNTNNFIQLIGASTPFGANVWANFDLNTGVVGSVGSSTTASIQSVGNGWYRCIMVGTSTSASSPSFNVSLITSATSARAESNTLSTSVFLWGAQLEAGAYATSFIPTTTASVTRNADSITRNNIYTNGLITAAGGTWFVELRNARALTRDASGNGIIIGSTTNGLSIRNGSGASLPAIFKYISGGATQILGTISSGTSKIAFKWNGSTADVFLNGVKVVSATAFAVTNMDSLSSGSVDVPSFINEMALFPTPLTDAQCLALTA